MHEAFLKEDSIEDKKGAKKGDERKQDILNLLAEYPTMTQASLAEEIGFTRKQIQNSIKELQEEGLLVREGSRRNGQWIVKK